MTVTQLLNTTIEQKIGRNPVVILPLKTWREIENLLEEIEMAHSTNFIKKIAKARTQKKFYSSKDVKKLLGV